MFFRSIHRGKLHSFLYDIYNKFMQYSQRKDKIQGITSLLVAQYLFNIKACISSITTPLFLVVS